MLAATRRRTLLQKTRTRDNPQMTRHGHKDAIYYRGRYKTWTIIVRDEWKHRPDHATIWRCRTCGDWCKRASAKFCSKPCRKLWNRLVEHPLWFGNARIEATKRDGNRCVQCGAKERHRQGRYVALEVDHVLPVAVYPELEFEVSNLRTLCAPCHSRIGARPGTARYRAAEASRKLDAYLHPWADC